jgi:hypothetical protein
VGFIRTIGTILDAATIVPALVVQSKARLEANLKLPVYTLPRGTMRWSAKMTQILLDNKHRHDRKFAAKLKRELAA